MKKKILMQALTEKSLQQLRELSQRRSQEENPIHAMKHICGEAINYLWNKEFNNESK